jgi:ubiquinone/menaquinone biosynthesis C-methylase UbiE
MSAPTNVPSPELFFETANAHQRSAALKAAIDLKVFTAIGSGELTDAEIAAKCNSSEKGIRVLCDYLTILGFLTKNESKYKLTSDSAIFLDQKSPAYVGSAMDFLGAPEMLEVFSDLTSVIRKGGTVLPTGGTVAPEHPIWANFAKAMAPIAAFTAQGIAGLMALEQPSAKKVLDIAAGHGMYGIALAQKNSNARIWAQDWPHVLEVAKENAKSAGVSDRYSTIPGSAFDVDFGSGYDIVLLTNFLHHFDFNTCVRLLRKIRKALASGGKVATLEFVPNEDRISPPIPASFALTMLATTENGDAHPFSVLEQMFREAGFSKNTLHSIPPIVQRVVVSAV